MFEVHQLGFFVCRSLTFVWMRLRCDSTLTIYMYTMTFVSEFDLELFNRWLNFHVDISFCSGVWVRFCQSVTSIPIFTCLLQLELALFCV